MGNILHLDHFQLPAGAIFDPARFGDPELGLQVEPSFHIAPTDHIFVVGSCFAAEVLKTLRGLGFRATDAGLGYKYNVFSILQSVRWALQADFDASLLARLQDGRWFDGHRHPFWAYPERAEGAARHRQLLEQARCALAECDVLVLTLGLVEVWRDTGTGVVLNQTPPVAFLDQPSRFQARRTTHGENLSALRELLQILGRIRPGLRVLCTVSPVPLKASFCSRDVLIANAYSKSTLRSVVDEALEAERQDSALAMDYFPAYELATLSPREQVWCATIRDQEPDGRHVRRDFVEQVIMRLFLRHYVQPTA
jgi:hypothetical protein